MNKHIQGEFIAIQQRLFECEALDIYHINIIAWISSYQRQGQPFFMSKTELAKRFKCNMRTIIRRLDELELIGIIYKDGKVKRSWRYKVNSAKLDYCLRVNNLETLLTQSQTSQKIVDSSTHYNTNNKTSSNKTSFRDEDDFKSSSSSKPKAKPKVDVNSPEFHKFLNELDI